MKFKAILFALLVISLIAPHSPSHAQVNQPPMIVLSGMDLWMVDGAKLKNLTESHSVYGATLSPDGTKIAFNAWSPITVEAVQREGGFSGFLPSDVRILDLTTLQISDIATQPADASFATDGVPDSALLRSTPTWSPDGTRLAWGEIHYPSFASETHRIVIADLNTGSTSVLVTNLPEQMGEGGGPVTVTWGSSGIAFVSFEYDTAANVPYTSIYVYNDQNGSLLSSTKLTESDTQRYSAYMWVNNGEAIAVEYAPSGWDLLDPSTGALQSGVPTPELVNPLVSDSAALIFAYHPDAEWPDFYSWILTYADGQQIEGQNRVSGVPRVTLGPDGHTMAEVTTDGQIVYLMPDMQVIEGPILDDSFATLFWGPTAWRITGELTPSTQPPTAGGQQPACGSALPPRLIVGGTGQVIPNTTPNNVRSQPKTGDVVAQIQPSESFQVIAGPQCVDGMYWWQVNFNGTIGWTAEGDSNGYWVEPIPG